jgi:DNA polymerase I-like protein with 3'-5' exonuclease and polymerase domains
MVCFVLAGVLYGMGTQATATKLGIDVARASSIISTFFDRFKQIKVWIQRVKRYDDVPRRICNNSSETKCLLF